MEVSVLVVALAEVRLNICLYCAHYHARIYLKFMIAFYVF